MNKKAKNLYDKKNKSIIVLSVFVIVLSLLTVLIGGVFSNKSVETKSQAAGATISLPTDAQTLLKSKGISYSEVQATAQQISFQAKANSDINRSGRVDLFDLSILASNFGKYYPTNEAARADIDGNNRIDKVDAANLAKWYGQFVSACELRDINRSGFVDRIDTVYLEKSNCYNRTPLMSVCRQMDINADNLVNLKDVSLIADIAGTNCNPAGR